ncbi:MAG: hypothetical protein GXO78_08860 [Calditrichaeota bacterium]|nr:hypothetical protein [Calditrichota bacterium]
MRILIFLGFILLITSFFLFLIPTEQAIPEAESILLLGATLMVAYLFGRFINRYRLPKITGYLLTGIIIGPDVLNILSQRNVTDLQLIDNVALSLIALTAGGEFKISKVKEQLKLIVSVTMWQIIIVLIGITIIVMSFSPLIPFLKGQAFTTILGVGLIFGVLAVAKSPATTIAIITETKSSGPFTNFILGITILKDIIIVLLFAFVLALTQPLVSESATFQLHYVQQVFLEILMSLGTGMLVGLLIYVYLRYIEMDFFLFLFSLILLVIEISQMLHLELILIFMMAGFVVQNFTRFGDDLLHTIEKSSLPVYVTFFAIAGASLKISIFLQNWLFTLILVSARMFTTHLGTWVGSHLANGTQHVKRYGWMGFIGQAGLTLGLSVILEKELPPPLGSNIKTIIVAAIAINQIVGPVLFRYSLWKSGEIPEERPSSAEAARSP